MIYLFTGSDEAKAREKAFEWVVKARAKDPQLTYLRLAREDLSPGALDEAASAGTLFAKRLLVLLDDPYPKRGAKDEEEGAEESGEDLLEEWLPRLAESENAIVILAPGLAAAKAKKIGGKAEKVYDLTLRARKEERGFNGALVNALAAGDGAKLWLELERAFLKGDAPEQVHGLLHWKARDLMSKGRKDGRALSLALISLLVETRRKGLDLSESLERFALSL